jgi:CubicO group peptidase (beta-lactamase class C family)
MGLLLRIASLLPLWTLLAHAEDPVATRVKRIEDRWKPAQTMARLHVPGVSMALIRDSKIEWVRPYGVKSAKAKSAAVDVATLFQAASISKPVAAVAAMHMSQYGNFGLDQDVNATLQSWKVKDTPFTADAKVTLRGLLSHSAGLTVHGFGGYAQGDPVPDVVQVLNGDKPANSAPVVVDTVPGTKWRYSGGGYTILQLMMQERFKKPFADIMEMIVLGRIGMRDSTYAQPLPRPLHIRAASGHDKNGHTVKGDWHTYPEQAAAGLWTTPSDLARFLIEVQKSALGESNRVIEKKTAEEMLRIQKGSYGLGFQIDANGGFGHGGSNAGFKCLMRIGRNGDGFVIMTNGDRGLELIQEVAAAVESEYGWKKSAP